MPISVKATAGGSGYASPMVGPVDQTVHVKLDVSTLTTAEVDADGYLKPGVLVKQDGTPVAATQAVFGVVVEPTFLALAVIPPTNTSLGADTSDPLIAVCTHGIVNQDIAAANLGRAYTAAEIAGFSLAGSTLKLTST
jgi:hypothetical protein